jgi:hypothetical protein
MYPPSTKVGRKALSVHFACPPKPHMQDRPAYRYQVVAVGRAVMPHLIPPSPPSPSRLLPPPPPS